MTYLPQQRGVSSILDEGFLPHKEVEAIHRSIRMPKVERSKFPSLSAYLQAIWLASSLRTVGREFCMFPLRIAALLSNPMLRQGSFPIDRPLDFGSSRTAFLAECECQQHCMRHIQQLQAKYRWMGPLEMRMAYEAEFVGAMLGYRSVGSESDS
jgi:hypothetical protein